MLYNSVLLLSPLFLIHFTMPFTLSHAVLAPPIAKYTRLPLASVVIGCMVPDLTRLLNESFELAMLAHTWKGLIYPDLWIGLIFSLLWYVLYRPVIYHFLKLEDALPFQSWQAGLWFLLGIPIGIIAGTATHIVWDGLTHLDFRTFAFHQTLAMKITIPYLGLSYPLHSVLQIACSILALPILLYALGRYYRHFKQKDVDLTGMDSLLALIFFTVPLGYASLQTWQFYQKYHYLKLYDLIGRGFNVFSFSTLMVSAFLALLILIFQQFRRD